MNSITETANITKGLTNRVEVCVINNMFSYDFNINRASDINRVVEKPKLPTLIIGEGGIVQDGLTEQSKMDYKNHYEMIEHDRYKQVKELMGYMGSKTAEYDLFKVENKDTETPAIFTNCGSDEITEVAGNIYQPDNGFGGSTYSRPDNPIVSGGKWEQLYQTARSMGESETGTLSWEFDLDTNTYHKINLRFADYWGVDKIFDIIVNGRERRKEFSIIGRSGGVYKRTDISFKVPVNDNKLELSLVGGGHINAIEIYRLDKGDVEFVEASRNDVIENKDVFLFVHKSISVSENNLKKKFFEIQNTILKSRNLFFF